MTNHVHEDDLPENVTFSEKSIAIDTETKGLNIYKRDRLCVVQLSDGHGDAHLVQFPDGNFSYAKNLRKLLADDSVQKIFHFARFDMAAIKIFLGVDVNNVFCTKIASKLARTYTDKHGLKYLCKELLGVEISKQQQCSDWAGGLNKKQIEYAANDVLFLHEIKTILEERLEDEGRLHLAQKCFEFLPTRVELDIRGWDEADIFHHA